MAAELGERSREEDVATRVEAADASPDQVSMLVELMRERHPVYRGRSTNATIRMRGYAMAAFERVGLPEPALLYALEELESGREPYLVAAAAKALRGLIRRERRLVPFLLRAIDNVRYHDDMVTFERYLPTWPAESPTTALAEVFRTLGWLGPNAALALPRLTDFKAIQLPPVTRAALTRAISEIQTDGVPEESSCCRRADPRPFGILGRSEPVAASGAPPMSARFEDQDGLRLTYRDFFSGRPSVVVFFYTRCTNPNKCSLTITKLAELQKQTAQLGLSESVRTAAITYDPDFDLPPRLRAYGDNRGVVFADDHRLLRATRGFDAIATYFELGVNYGPAAVNQHRIEAFVLDDNGRITTSFTRLQWDVRQILDEAIAAPADGRRSGRGRSELFGAAGTD
ncbi:MAG: SCO family protein [Chloroflexi bacterium]|nr:SCO family protein [Chloroflexota bacterium]